MDNISRIKLDKTTYEIKDAQAARASDLALKQDALTAGNGIAIDNSDVIRTTGIPFGTCDSTSTSKVFTATVPGIYKLEDGVCCIIKNGVVTSESDFTLNVNGLGAKPSYSNMATGNDVTPTDPTRDTTIFNINYAMLFVYSSTIVDGGGWICYRGYDGNTNLADVAFSGDYNDLDNIPTIPAAQIQSNWNETNTNSKAYILNKPTIPVGITAASSQSNGSWILTLSSGDTITIDLNHSHPQYLKYLLITQANYIALDTKDSSTLYLIPES